MSNTTLYAMPALGALLATLALSLGFAGLVIPIATAAVLAVIGWFAIALRQANQEGRLLQVEALARMSK